MFEEQLQAIADDRLTGLVREDELGGLNFQDAVGKLLLIGRMARAFLSQGPGELPNDLISQVGQRLGQIVQIIERMEKFTLVQDGSATQHQQIANEIEGQRDWFASAVRPHIRVAEVALANATARAQGVLAEAEANAAEVGKILSGLRRSSGEVGAGTLSDHYSKQADVHRDRARSFLWMAGAVIAIALAAGWGLFASLATNEDWDSLARGIAERAFYLGVLGYIVAFAVRGYRSNEHLRVIHEQKRSALDTYALFAEAATSDEARDLISAELVRTVFSVAESGLLIDAPADRRVADGNLGLFSFLLARRSY